MKRLIALLAAAAACAALAVPALAGTRTVEVGPRIRFGPQSINLRRGDTIRFRFTGKLFHDVVRRRGPGFRTIGVHRGGTFLRRFTRRGTYLLICRVHQPTMDLTVHVR
jgi:plastocyanin